MRKQYVVELITKQANVSKAVAESVVERLQDEGLLHLGHGSADIDIVVQKFTDTFGTTKVSRQDRWAANRLVSKYGSQAICGIVDLLAENSTEKFTPVVNSVAQLEDKMPSVLNFLRNIKKDETIQL